MANLARIGGAARKPSKGFRVPRAAGTRASKVTVDQAGQRVYSRAGRVWNKVKAAPWKQAAKSDLKRGAIKAGKFAAKHPTAVGGALALGYANSARSRQLKLNERRAKGGRGPAQMSSRIGLAAFDVAGGTALGAYGGATLAAGRAVSKQGFQKFNHGMAAATAVHTGRMAASSPYGRFAKRGFASIKAMRKGGKIGAAIMGGFAAAGAVSGIVAARRMETGAKGGRYYTTHTGKRVYVKG
jgi:hypothetical protein